MWILSGNLVNGGEAIVHKDIYYGKSDMWCETELAFVMQRLSKSENLRGKDVKGQSK